MKFYPGAFVDMPYLNTEGVILHQRPLGEADRQVILFTLDRGKIFARARGGKRLWGRWAASLQPLVWADFCLYQKKRSSPWSLIQIRMKRADFRLRNDLKRARYALEAARLIHRMTAIENPEPEFLHLFLGFLQALASRDNPEILRLVFQLRLLSYAGFLPSLRHCGVCGEKFSQGSVFFKEGILCCSDCEGISYGHRFSSFSFTKLESWLHPPLSSQKIEKEMLYECSLFLEKSFQFHIGEK